jgi:hypothetical protein
MHHMEWSSLERRLMGSVVAIFRPGQPAEPAARPVTDEAPQIHGDDPIGDLRLPVSLQPERRAQAEPCTRQAEQVL